MPNQRLVPAPNDLQPVEASSPGAAWARAGLRRRALLDSLPSVLQVEDVARPFAEALQALATGYNALSESLQAKQRTAWRGGMAQLVRKYHDIVIPAYSSVLVSEAALHAARQRQIDLYRMDWSQQPRFDPGRTVFHLEHVVTVATVVQRCLVGSEQDIFQTLTSQALQVA